MQKKSRINARIEHSVVVLYPYVRKEVVQTLTGNAYGLHEVNGC